MQFVSMRHEEVYINEVAIMCTELEKQLYHYMPDPIFFASLKIQLLSQFCLWDLIRLFRVS